MSDVPKLYGIWDPDVIETEPLGQLRRALEGGLIDVQLRLRSRAARLLAVEAARAIKEVDGRVWINRDLGLAHQLSAHGIHLGANGATPTQARNAIPDHSIGLSHHVGQALPDGHEHVTFLLLSPIYATPSKPDVTPIGPDAIATMAEQAHHAIVALGGVTPENTASCLAAGATGVAAMRAIFGADDPATAVEAFLKALP